MSALSLDEAKAHLNITADTQDDELTEFIAAAEAAISSRIGPLGSETRTARVLGGGTMLLLPSWPVQSVTGLVQSDGTVVDTTTLTLTTDVGTVEVTEGGRFDASTYLVTYEAGYDTLPDDLLFAVKEMVRHLWENSQRGRSSRRGAEPAPTAGYLIPNAVAELLEPYRVPRVS